MSRWIQNKLAVLAIIIVIVVTGAVQFLSLDVTLFPQIEQPTINFGISNTGMTASEFVQEYGPDLEAVLRSIQDAVETTYTANLDQVWGQVVFPWGFDGQEAKSIAEQQLTTLRGRLPQHMGGPWTMRDWSGRNGRMSVLVTPTNSTPEGIEDLATRLEPMLVALMNEIDASEAWVSNPYQSRVNVTFRMDALHHEGLTLLEAMQQISGNRTDQTVGQIQQGNTVVRLEKRPRELADLESLTLRSETGRWVKLIDVADIEVIRQPSRWTALVGGEPAMFISVSPEPEANLVDFSRNVRDRLDILRERFAGEATFQLRLDPGEYILNAVRSVVLALLIAIGLSSIVVMLFFGRLPLGAITAASIPLSVLAAFSLLQIFGVGLNLLSLGAMALAVGMVIDGAIVVMENSLRHLSDSGAKTLQARTRVIVSAVKEVALPVIAGISTTIVVFLPLIFTEPLAAALLQEIAIVTSLTLFMSIFVALLLVPTLVLIVATPERLKPLTKQEMRRPVLWPHRVFMHAYTGLKQRYLRLLERGLGHHRPLAISLLTLVILGGVSGSLLAWMWIDREIIAQPTTDKLSINTTSQLDLDSSVYKEKLAEVEQAYAAAFGDELVSVYSWIWDGRESGQGVNTNTTVQVDRPIDEDFAEEAVARITPSTSQFNHEVNRWNPSTLTFPNPPDIELVLFESTGERLIEAIEILESRLRAAFFAGDLRMRREPWSQMSPGLVIAEQPWYASMTDFGLPNPPGMDQLTQQLSSALDTGRFLTFSIHLDSKTLPVDLELPPDLVKDADALTSLLVPYQGALIPVSQWLTAKPSPIESSLLAQEGNISTKLNVWVNASYSGSQEEALTRIQQVATELAQDIGIAVQFSYPAEFIDQNWLSVLSSLGAVLLLILLVLSVQFGRLGPTLITMIPIVLGLFGVAWSLIIFNSTLSINSMLGVLLVAGTSVNNSILFIDFYHRMRRQHPERGVDWWLMETARLRLRPIMMTTLTTVLGMVPLILAMGDGGKIMQPLGIAVAGGLTISTLITLVLLPCLLKWTEPRSAQVTADKPPRDGGALFGERAAV